MKKSILVGLLALWLIVSVVPVFAQERDQTDAAWQSWREGKIADAHTTVEIVAGEEKMHIDYAMTVVLFAGLATAGLVAALLLGLDT